MVTKTIVLLLVYLVPRDSSILEASLSKWLVFRPVV